MPDSPPGAERCGGSRSALAPRCDQRRHRGDVIRVGRVAQPEGRRRGARPPPTRPRRAGDPVVEPKHASCSRERTVRFERCLEHAGERSRGDRHAHEENESRAHGRERADERTVERRRPKARRAKTATSPMPVIVAARPTLNARISTNPRPTRWSAIAESRTTSAEGTADQPRSQPRGCPSRSDRRRRGDGGARGHAVIVIVRQARRDHGDGDRRGLGARANGVAGGARLRPRRRRGPRRGSARGRAARGG